MHLYIKSYNSERLHSSVGISFPREIWAVKQLTAGCYIFRRNLRAARSEYNYHIQHSNFRFSTWSIFNTDAETTFRNDKPGTRFHQIYCMAIWSNNKVFFNDESKYPVPDQLTFTHSIKWLSQKQLLTPNSLTTLALDYSR